MPKSRSFVVVALFVLAACGTSEPGGALSGERPHGGGKADAAQASSDFDELLGLLRADGTLGMPPIGIANAANELDVEITVHAADEVKEVVRGLIAEASESYVVDAATGTLVDHYDDDINVSLVSGWNDEALRAELLATVASGKRAAVSALVDGYLLRFRIYQTASEITAEEIFVYRPTDLDRAIVIRFSYAHA